jgi:hypothetical protein
MHVHVQVQPALRACKSDCFFRRDESVSAGVMRLLVQNTLSCSQRNRTSHAPKIAYTSL